MKDDKLKMKKNDYLYITNLSDHFSKAHTFT